MSKKDDDISKWKPERLLAEYNKLSESIGMYSGIEEIRMRNLLAIEILRRMKK